MRVEIVHFEQVARQTCLRDFLSSPLLYIGRLKDKKKVAVKNVEQLTLMRGRNWIKVRLQVEKYRFGYGEWKHKRSSRNFIFFSGKLTLFFSRKCEDFSRSCEVFLKIVNFFVNCEVLQVNHKILSLIENFSWEFEIFS